MLDMGFEPQIRKLVQRSGMRGPWRRFFVPRSRQSSSHLTSIEAHETRLARTGHHNLDSMVEEARKKLSALSGRKAVRVASTVRGARRVAPRYFLGVVFVLI